MNEIQLTDLDKATEQYSANAARELASLKNDRMERDQLIVEIENAKKLLWSELDKEYDKKDTLYTLITVAVNALYYARSHNTRLDEKIDNMFLVI